MALTADNLAHSQHSRGRRGSASGRRSPSQGNLSPQYSAISGSHSAVFSLDAQSDPGSVHSKKSKRGPASPGGTTSEGGSENVKVICRVRPFNAREFELHDEMNAKFDNEWDKRPLRSVIEMEGPKTIFLDHEKEYSERDRFGFDASLWSIPDDQQASPNGFCEQIDVMNEVGAPTLKHVWNGFNTTVFAYGQTGSGKTFSMMGAGKDDNMGLIPRICVDLFASVEKKREEDAANPVEGTVHEYKLEARFLEIYNERVRDLLWAIRPKDQPTESLDPLNMKVRNLPNVGPQVVGITCMNVSTSDDCLKLIEEGTRHRSVAATKMNSESSRSHSIFRLTLVQTTKVLPTKQFEKPKIYDRTSVISLVDLAGSERNKKTGAEGARLKEAVAINQSLTSLKNVIDALVEGRTVIPFRDSQLTWLLSESLGGNSKTFMIACISPHLDNGEESLNTLRYAARAQKIINHASVNESEEMRKMNKLREEMDRLQRMATENPNEQLLQEEMEDQKNKLKELQEEELRRHAEEEQLSKRGAKHESMRFTQGFQHAFRVIFYRRLERRYRDANILLKQQIDVQVGDKTRLLSKIGDTNKLTKDARTKEHDSRTLREELDARLKQLKDSCSSLEVEKTDLVAKEDRLKDAQEKKTELVQQAKHMGKILCAHRRYVFDKKIEKVNAVTSAKKKVLAEDQVTWNLDSEEAHVKKMLELQEDQGKKREKLAELKATLDQTNKTNSERIGKLHAACIFYENERRRCAPDLERGLATVNKACSAKFYEDKEEWSSKINSRQGELDAETAALSEEFQQRNTSANLDDANGIENAEIEGRDAYDRTIRQNEKSLVSLDDTWSNRLKMLEALNVDTEFFLKETRQSEPRYAKLHEDVAYLLDDDLKTLPDAQVVEVATKLRKVRTRLESIAPQPYKATGSFEEHHCDPVPVYGMAPAPRKHRTASPTMAGTVTPNGSVSSPVTPVQTPRGTIETAKTLARRATSPSTSSVRPTNRDRTMNLDGPHATQRRDVGTPRSLKQPSVLIPTTTKTSRLRTEHLTTKAAAASSMGSTTPRRSTTPTQSHGDHNSARRSMTPRTARETLSFLLQDEPKKISTGDGGRESSYFVSRSRSPKATPYRAPPNVQYRAATPRSGTPGTPGTPRTNGGTPSTPRR